MNQCLQLSKAFNGYERIFDGNSIDLCHKSSWALTTQKYEPVFWYFAVSNLEIKLDPNVYQNLSVNKFLITLVNDFPLAYH